jgi:hypothetical protein
MILHPVKVTRSPVVKRARCEPARLRSGNRNFWEDMREVLLDSEPAPWELEIVRRWLRDDVERELKEGLGGHEGIGLVRLACRLAPRLIWTLPFSRALPPERHHRRIVAILLPLRLKRVEQELAVYAFHEGLS